MAKSPSITSPDVFKTQAESFLTTESASDDWRSALGKVAAKQESEVDKAIADSQKQTSYAIKSAMQAVASYNKEQDRKARQQALTLKRIKTAADIPQHIVEQIPTFDKFKPADYDQMGYKQQAEEYTKYAKSMSDQLKSVLAGSEITDGELRKLLSSRNEAFKPVEPTRGTAFISAAGDVLGGAAASALRTVAGISSLNPIQSAVDQASSAITGSPSANMQLNDAAKWIEDLQSDVVKDSRKSAAYENNKAAQQHLAETGEEQGFIDSTLTELKNYASNFNAADAGGLVFDIGSSLFGGGIAAKGGQVVAKAIPAVSRIAASSPKLAKTANILNFSVGATLAPSALQANTAIDHVRNMPNDVLAQSPAFLEILQKNNGDFALSKEEYALSTGSDVMKSTMLIGTLANVVPGSWVSKLASPSKLTGVGAGIRGAIGAGTIAAADATAETAAMNYFINKADREWGLDQGIGVSAVMGGVLGGVLGGGAEFKSAKRLSGINLELKRSTAEQVAREMGVENPDINVTDTATTITGTTPDGNTVNIKVDGQNIDAYTMNADGKIVSRSTSKLADENNVSQTIDKDGILYEQTVSADDAGVTSKETSSLGTEVITRTYSAEEGQPVKSVKVVKDKNGIESITHYSGNDVVSTIARQSTDSPIYRNRIKDSEGREVFGEEVYMDVKDAFNDPVLAKDAMAKIKDLKAESTAAPKVDDGTTPKAEDGTTPKAEDGAAPKMEDATAPKAEAEAEAEETPAPKAEETPAPKAEETPAPKSAKAREEALAKVDQEIAALEMSKNGMTAYERADVNKQIKELKDQRKKMEVLDKDAKRVAELDEQIRKAEADIAETQARNPNAKGGSAARAKVKKLTRAIDAMKAEKDSILKKADEKIADKNAKSKAEKEQKKAESLAKKREEAEQHAAKEVEEKAALKEKAAKEKESKADSQKEHEAKLDHVKKQLSRKAKLEKEIKVLGKDFNGNNKTGDNTAVRDSLAAKKNELRKIEKELKATDKELFPSEEVYHFDDAETRSHDADTRALTTEFVINRAKKGGVQTGHLLNILSNGSQISPSVKSSANALMSFYKGMGKLLPTIKVVDSINGGKAHGLYDANTNTITIARDANIHVALHEISHGVSVDGFNVHYALRDGAKISDPALAKLVKDIRSRLTKKELADITNVTTVLDKVFAKAKQSADILGVKEEINAFRNPAELLAEMLANPKIKSFIDGLVISDTTFSKAEIDSLNNIGVKFGNEPSAPKLSENKIVRAGQIVYRALANILAKIMGRQTKPITVPVSRILDALQNRFSEFDRVKMASKIGDDLFKVTADAPAYFLVNAEKAGDAGAFISDITANDGKVKTFQYTSNLHILRNMYSEVKQGTKITEVLNSQLARSGIGDATVTKLFDSLHPMVVAFDKLSEKHPHLKETMDSVINGFRTMQDRANLFKNKLEPHQDAIMQIVIKGAKEMNVDAETAMSTMGYYLTARHHANAYKKALRNIDEEIAYQKTIVSKKAGSEISKDKAAAAKAAGKIKSLYKTRDDFIKQYNDPDINAKLTIEQPGGMTKVQAEALLKSTGDAIPDHLKPELEKATARLVADQLTLEVANGMVAPKTVARFLGKPELEAHLDALIAKRDARKNNLSDAERADYEAQFKKVSEMLENDYVPYSTYLSETIGGDNLIPTKDNILRSSETQRIMGSLQVPADGLSGVFANVVKSANRYGQRELLSNLSHLYNSLERTKDLATIGFSKLEVTAQHLGALQVGKTSGILVPGKGDTPSVIYAFSDPKINNALNKVLQANLAGNNLATKILRTMVGSMTTYNPLFHSAQYLRNRKELLDAASFRIGELGEGIQKQWSQIEREVTRKMWFGKTLSDTLKSVFRGKHSTTMKDMMEYGAIGAKYANIFDVRKGADINKRLSRMKNPVKRTMHAVGKFLENMNHATDVAPKAALFEALVNRGVSKERAAWFVRDIADYGKSGDFSKHWYGRSVAFFKPAFVGLDSIRKGVFSRDKHIRRKAYGRLAKRVMFYVAIESAYRSIMGDDDTRSDYGKTAYTYLPFGDSSIKLPVAYGLSRVAKALANLMLDAGDDTADMSKSVSSMINNGFIANFSPIDPPEVNFFEHPLTSVAATVAPTVLQPVVFMLSNTSSFGQTISKDKSFQNMGTPYYEISKGDMAKEYTDLSKWFYETFGLDYDPAYFKFFTESFTPGITGEIRKIAIDNPNARAMGKGVATRVPLFEDLPDDVRASNLYYANIDKARNVVKRLEVKGEDYIPTSKEEAIAAVYASLTDEFKSFRKQVEKDIKNSETQQEAKEIKALAHEYEVEFFKAAHIQLREVLKIK